MLQQDFSTTFSLAHLSARATLREAFARVHENGGCRGADGVTVEAFARDLERQLDSLEDSLLADRYYPLPLLHFAVPKPRGGRRFLAVPTVRDRVLQTAVYRATLPLFEAEFEEMSYGYRPGRSVKQVVRRIDDLRSQGYRWVVDADIHAFFDHLPHDRLLDRLRRLPLPPHLMRLFTRWIQAEVYDGKKLWRLEQGIPQGSVVSPMLANLFLDQLDENLALFGQIAVRWADDFLILCKRPDEAAAALELTDYLLADLELELNLEKTQIASFEQGFKFLGALFVGDAVYVTLSSGKKKEQSRVALPPPLDLVTYLELKHALPGEPPCPPSI